MKNSSQVKTGIVLSYILIVINTLYGIVITPYIIRVLGSDEYGVYKTIGSLTASLIVIDLGIGGTVQRYVAKYIAEKRTKEISNFVAMNYIQAAILSGVLGLVCIILFLFIEPAYDGTLNVSQLHTAKVFFVIMSLGLVLQFFGDVSNGVIVGYNHFSFGNGIKLLKILLRIVSVYVFLIVFKSAITLAIIDFSLTFIVILLQRIYIKKRLHLSVVFEKWDKSVFFESGKYTIFMFLTTLVTQINSNVDNVIVGAISGPNYVTVYSIGLLFFGMFQSISAAVSGVMLPTITNALAEKKSTNRINDIIVKAGRLQFTIIGAGIVGFVFLGKDFITIWLGDNYSDAYIISMILVIPSIFELCINVCLSILRAQNRLVFRTIVVTISTVINIIITIIAVKYWSYIGAAVGTAFSYIACSLISMNIYYSKVIGLPMISIYRRITKGIWLCLLISGAALAVSSSFFAGSYLCIGINVLVFCLVYGISLVFIGLDKEEKSKIPVISKIK